jgi:hypothetical protein
MNPHSHQNHVNDLQHHEMMMMMRKQREDEERMRFVAMFDPRNYYPAHVYARPDDHHRAPPPMMPHGVMAEEDRKREEFIRMVRDCDAAWGTPNSRC